MSEEEVYGKKKKKLALHEELFEVGQVESDEYLVDKIVDFRMTEDPKNPEYFVKWKHSSWRQAGWTGRRDLLQGSDEQADRKIKNFEKKGTQKKNAGLPNGSDDEDHDCLCHE